MFLDLTLTPTLIILFLNIGQANTSWQMWKAGSIIGNGVRIWSLLAVEGGIQCDSMTFTSTLKTPFKMPPTFLITALHERLQFRSFFPYSWSSPPSFSSSALPIGNASLQLKRLSPTSRKQVKENSHRPFFSLYQSPAGCGLNSTYTWSFGKLLLFEFICRTIDPYRLF